MKVEELMTKDALACRPDETLAAAARIMWERDCGSVPVVSREEAGRVLGMITDRDVCMAAYTQGKRLEEITVHDAMSKGLASCAPGDSVKRAEELMRDHQVRRLPVTDGSGALLGVVSLADLARAGTGANARKSPNGRTVGETLAAIVRETEQPSRAPA